MIGASVFTWANLVTLVRAGLGIVLLVEVIAAVRSEDDGLPRWPVVAALATVNLILDGVDGWLARRLDQTGPVGARLDVEVDSAIMIIMAVALVVTGGYGWWVLGYGLWRYVWMAARWLAPRLRGPLPPRRSRRTVAGCAMVAVILALVAVGTGATPIGTVVAAAGLIAVSWSFLRDAVDLIRRGPGSAPATA